MHKFFVPADFKDLTLDEANATSKSASKDDHISFKGFFFFSFYAFCRWCEVSVEFDSLVCFRLKCDRQSKLLVDLKKLNVASSAFYVLVLANTLSVLNLFKKQTYACRARDGPGAKIDKLHQPQTGTNVFVFTHETNQLSFNLLLATSKFVAFLLLFI